MECAGGNPCKAPIHWTVFHGTILTAAEAISKTGFRCTPARYGELGEGVYGTCVKPNTPKSDVVGDMTIEIEKAKRFAHDFDLRKNPGEEPTNIPVLLILTVTFEKIEIRTKGSDPEGEDTSDSGKAWAPVGKASQWKIHGNQAVYTTSTDGAREPHIATTISELCFKPSNKVQQMRIVELSGDGCPTKRAGRGCKYEKGGFTCPCEKDA
jgi:hypothetical protein